jgi:hypothetical protein
MARIFVCNWYFEQSVVTIAAYRLCEADYELKSHLADACLLSSSDVGTWYFRWSAIVLMLPSAIVQRPY